MELSDFSCLVDENISNELIQYLKDQHIYFISVREEKMKGYPNETVVQLAEEKNLVFITHDSEFGKLFLQRQVSKPEISFKAGPY